MQSIGKKWWAIAKGYIPSGSTEEGRQFARTLASDVDVPIAVQHTRLDSRQAELVLLSTIA